MIFEKIDKVSIDDTCCLLLKHSKIIKFSTTTKCDLSFDSLSKNKCTLKISASYLLYSLRNLTKSVLLTYRDYKIMSNYNYMISFYLIEFYRDI